MRGPRYQRVFRKDGGHNDLPFRAGQDFWSEPQKFIGPNQINLAQGPAGEVKTAVFSFS